jgi:hypothetical protein
MLMIPKTLAYVAIGFIAYADLYRSAGARSKRTIAEQASSS